MSFSPSLAEMGNCSKLDMEKVIADMEKDLEKLQGSHRENIDSLTKLAVEYDKLCLSHSEEFEKLFSKAKEEVKNMQSSTDKTAVESLRKFTEEHKKREDLDRRISELRKELDAGELAVKQRKGTLNVLKLINDGGDIETIMKMDEVEDRCEYLDDLNHTLIVKERKGHDELDEARKALLEAFSDPSNNSDIGVKIMGELDYTVFLKEVKKKHSCEEKEAYDIAFEIFWVWEEYLKDPDWHPLKVVNVNGQHKDIVIDEEDGKLKNLKNDYGKDVFNAVTTALKERMEHNPIQRRAIEELWNYKHNRIATVGEGVAHLLKLWNDGRTEEF